MTYHEHPDHSADERRSFLLKGASLSCAAGATMLLSTIRSTAVFAADGPVAETTSGKIGGVSTGGEARGQVFYYHSVSFF